MPRVVPLDENRKILWGSVNLWNIAGVSLLTRFAARKSVRLPSANVYSVGKYTRVPYISFAYFPPPVSREPPFYQDLVTFPPFSEIFVTPSRVTWKLPVGNASFISNGQIMPRYPSDWESNFRFCNYWKYSFHRNEIAIRYIYSV